MKKEKSCGAVVYTYKKNKLHLLILKMQMGHYSLPKGHVENNETEVETALREIKEETNLKVEIDTNFRRVVTYSPFEGILKDVVFFVAKYKSGKIIEQEKEVAIASWMPVHTALETLTHESDKKVVLDAIEYIQQNDRNEG